MSYGMGYVVRDGIWHVTGLSRRCGWYGLLRKPVYRFEWRDWIIC